jgi:hypothetical protein
MPLRGYALIAVVLAASGCAGAPTLTAPDAPAALRPPAGDVLFLEARGSGVQIYECALKPGAPPTYEWTFKGPEAALTDGSGHSLGKHYTGPTWESNDGSSVVGKVKAQDPGPSASAVPWLLLTAKTTSGSGIFSATTSIQRLKTVGGVAPTEACGASNAAQVARVPYTATYYFYRAAR